MGRHKKQGPTPEEQTAKAHNQRQDSPMPCKQATAISGAQPHGQVETGRDQNPRVQTASPNGVTATNKTPHQTAICQRHPNTNCTPRSTSKDQPWGQAEGQPQQHCQTKSETDWGPTQKHKHQTAKRTRPNRQSREPDASHTHICGPPYAQHQEQHTTQRTQSTESSKDTST